MNNGNSIAATAETSSRRGTAQKLRVLRTMNEDFEWYPTTPEIMKAMHKDIFDYLESHYLDYSNSRHGNDKVKLNTDFKFAGKKRTETFSMHLSSFLDIGAGDGRVLELFPADEKYAIEIATAQADDLIRRKVFLIGRNFWDVSLAEQEYGLVFSNPPYSLYADWVNKILYECNFEILYLVMPVRWKNEPKITKEMSRYESAVVGEFDFSQADREARGRVNLVRVNAPWIKDAGLGRNCQQTLENTFERWIRDYITDFSNIPNSNYEYDRFEGDEKTALKLKLSPVDQLIEDYENEKETLRQAFSAIGKLPHDVIKMLGQDKASMIEIIRKAIEGLKSKYWRAAFNKLEPVKGRMTMRTRDRIFNRTGQFKTMDFNADNIYSIVIWIINNTNIGILDQIGEVFDEMTGKEYVQKYKSNRHWTKSDWRHTQSDWRYENLPERWKLDYRIVMHAYWSSSYDKYTIVDDFIIICKNLGFPVSPGCQPDYNFHSSEQKFYTEDGGLAFAMRFYTGNKNAHLKINQKLMMKFNVEVAKIRKWISCPEDIEEEFDVSKAESVKLWNSGLSLLGSGDMKMLEFKEVI